MSHEIQISDAAYQELIELATQQGDAPQAVIERLIAAARTSGTRYTTEEWFRHLGMSEAEMREALEQAEREEQQ